MTVKINKIYQKIGLFAMQNFKIGTTNNVSYINFYKLKQIEKILDSKNIDWEKLSKSREEIIFQIDSLNVI